MILKDYIKYWTFGAEADFDTYVTSQCTDEGKDLLKEVLKILFILMDLKPVNMKLVKFKENLEELNHN